MENILTKIKKRISELKAIDAAACEARWNAETSPLGKMAARDTSNEATFRRYELEEVLKLLTSTTSPIYGAPESSDTPALREIVTNLVKWIKHESDEIPNLSDCEAALCEPSEEEFRSAVRQWMKWTEMTFPESGAKASLIHLREEIEEVLRELDSDTPYPRQDNATMSLMEFADCFLCLLTAAGKEEISIEQLFRATMNKMKINYKRKWKLNPDKTYSHIKE